MKFVKYPLGHRLAMVHSVNPYRKSLRSYQRSMTESETDMYANYDDQLRIEDVYQADGKVVVLAVTYFGEPVYMRFSSWAAYYEAMLNTLLGEIK